MFYLPRLMKYFSYDTLLYFIPKNILFTRNIQNRKLIELVRNIFDEMKKNAAFVVVEYVNNMYSTSYYTRKYI